GDSSTNIQAAGNVTVNQNGLTIGQAKELYDILFKENFVKLQADAKEVASQRASEIIESYLDRLNSKDPSLLGNVKNPDIQYVVYEAQKSHARRGNKELADLLVDLLVDRTGEKEGTLLELVLNESLETAP